MAKRGLFIPEIEKELWYLDSEGKATPVENSDNGNDVKTIIQDIITGKREDPGQDNRGAKPGDFLVVEPGLKTADHSKISILIPERIGYTNAGVLRLLGNDIL